MSLQSITHMTSLLWWPWPQPNDPDICILHRYFEDVPAQQKWSS